ncbi:MAG: L-threonylcarbamoyladenylate synthase [Oscillospiraceae bacterium]
METYVTKTDIYRAAEIVKAGGLVGVPTETVYGLACDGLNAPAVERIYEVKGRPETKPISLLVSGMDDAEKFCVNIPRGAYVLAKKFWPGPLTMILQKRGNVPEVVTAGGNTVGIRCPAHKLTLSLIKLSGVPLAAPSANLSGMPSPKDAQAVLGYFNGKIECVIDGGECSVGVESTIVDLTAAQPKILRQGGLPAEEIERALGEKAAQA